MWWHRLWFRTLGDRRNANIPVPCNGRVRRKLADVDRDVDEALAKLAQALNNVADKPIRMKK